MKCYKTTIAISALIFSTSINAAIITETWSFTITSLENTTGYTVGDTVSFDITYNNTNESMSFYYSGQNGINEWGQGDDTLSRVACLDTYTSQSCTQTVSSNDLTLWTDGALSGLDFNMVTNNLLTGSSITQPYIPVNEPENVIARFSSVTAYSGRSDWLVIQSGVTSLQSKTSGSYFSLYGLDSSGTRVQSRVGFDHSGVTISAVSSVPVPAAVWLFSSGLIGLVSVARRTKV